MKNTIALIASATLILVLAAGCTGSKKHHGTDLPDPHSFNAHFGDMDADGDERVDAAEFKAFFGKGKERVFHALDLNRDGGIDHEEWHAFKEAHALDCKGHD